MKVKVYFKGLLKGSWLFEFVSHDEFKKFLNDNKYNIREYKIIE